MSQFRAKVNGVDCWCKVRHYRPHVPAKVSGPAEDCYPAEASEFECELYAPKWGNRMRGLEDRLTPADLDRLQDEYEAFVLAEKHGKNF